MISASNRLACNSKACPVAVMCNEHITNIYEGKNCHIFPVNRILKCQKKLELQNIKRKYEMKQMEKTSTYTYANATGWTTTTDNRRYGVWYGGTTED